MISSDLYACGYKVYIPSPRSRSESKAKAPSTTTPVKGSAHKTTKLLNPLESHLKDLGKTLEFGDDVVSEISPHLLSYSKSKGAAKLLFKADNLGFKTRSKPKHTLIGRYDCRGEPKKHLPCHLVSSASNPYAHIDRTAHTRNVTTRKDSDFIHHSESLHRSTNMGLYMAPSTKSVVWEDEVLGKVSSYTARRLVGKPSKPSVSDFSHPMTTRRRSSMKNASSVLFSDVISDGEPDELMSSPPHNFLDEYQNGARPVHQKMADRTKVVLDSGARFDAVVQDTFPYSPSEWCEDGGGVKGVQKVDNVKGYRKWLDFPQPTQTDEDLQWQRRDITSLTEPEAPDTCTSLSVSKPSTQNFAKKGYFDIIHEWCDRWQIHLQPKDIADSDTLLTEIHSLCDTTRMIAVASMALLAEQRALSQLSFDLSLKKRYHSEDKVVGLDEEMVEALRTRLTDSADHVRVPSAITLYCIDKQDKETEEALLSAVGGASDVESWASVQCLSKGGVATLAIVEELLTRLLNQPQTVVRKASQLLASLSSKTSLVHSLLAERLNCSGWLERLTACEMFPKLHGGINKDVCHKLVHLAWNDWSPEVRTGASQALGMTGHGKMIHDEIGRRLTNESETIRLDTLKKLQSLQLMTAQLLSPYLSCFSDEHTSIRIQAIKLAGALKLTHPKVQEALLSLLSLDHNWKIKVTTLQTLSECGQTNKALVSQLVWVIRFEKLGRVRAEGCRTIARLGLKDEKIVKTLKDLVIVEEDPAVKDEVIRTLEKLGCSGDPEDDMLERIRSEVKRLGTEEAIKEEVVGFDRSSTTRRVIQGSDKPAQTTRDILTYAGKRKSHRSQASTRPLPTTTTSQQSSKAPSPTPQQHNSPNSHTKDNTSTKTDSSLESKTPETDSNSSMKTGTSTSDTVDRAELNRSDLEQSAKARKEKVWTPDKEMIDNHLDKIRQQIETANLQTVD